MDHKYVAGEASTVLDVRMMRTRTALCGALLALVQEKPFEQVTVREITRRAGVGYATFFRRYPDKEALLNDIAEDEVRKLLDMTLPILFADDSRGACKALCAYVGEHRRLWTALMTGGAAATTRQEFIRQARLVAEGQPNPDTWIPGSLRVVYASGGAMDVLAWWLQQEPGLAPGRIAEILDRLVVAPTLADV